MTSTRHRSSDLISLTAIAAIVVVPAIVHAERAHAAITTVVRSACKVPGLSTTHASISAYAHEDTHGALKLDRLYVSATTPGYRATTWTKRDTRKTYTLTTNPADWHTNGVQYVSNTQVTVRWSVNGLTKVCIAYMSNPS